MSYEANEWVTDMDDANAPTEEPDDELQDFLAAVYVNYISFIHRRSLAANTNMLYEAIRRSSAA